MRKGIVKSFDKSCEMGTIEDLRKTDIRFYTESVIGKSRADLRKGDRVWFDVNGIKNLCIAVNITKCV